MIFPGHDLLAVFEHVCLAVREHDSHAILELATSLFARGIRSSVFVGNSRVSRRHGALSETLYHKMRILCGKFLMGVFAVLLRARRGVYWMFGRAEFEGVGWREFNVVLGRKKTRDLFDMDYVFGHSSPDVETVLRCWRRYKRNLGEDLPSWREFVLNVEAKLKDEEYRHGIDALLRAEVSFDPVSAWRLMRERIVDRLLSFSFFAIISQCDKE